MPFNYHRFGSYIGSDLAVPSKAGKFDLVTGHLVGDGLYPFTSFTFTNAGVSGRLGPTLAQLQTAYSAESWTQNTNYLNVTTQGIQEWTVPAGGAYTIRCVGASGGGPYSGYGADYTGTFTLSQGAVLKIVVGQEGLTQHPTYINGTGGGGSFVVEAPYTALSNALIVAGGGGGDAYNVTAVSNPYNRKNGQLSTSGGNGYGATSSSNGGTNGSGGSSTNRATGGGGFLTNGAYNSQSTGFGYGGDAFVNGAKGGENTSPDDGRDGPFGGGGYTQRTGFRGAGGGGGYSGGGTGSQNSSTGNCMGGGGGSVNNGSSQSNTNASTRGDGYVTITKV